MTWARVEHVRDQVVGLRPVYNNSGNATEMLLDNGLVLPDKRILKSVVAALARTYAVDLTAQRILVRNWLGKKTLLPFYIAADRVFIPLKMRQARAGNDETYGFVDVRFIESIMETGRRKCRISCRNGFSLDVLSGKSTVLKSQHSGQQLYALLGSSDNEDSDEERAANSARMVIRVLNKISIQLDRIEKKLCINPQDAQSASIISKNMPLNAK